MYKEVFCLILPLTFLSLVNLIALGRGNRILTVLTLIISYIIGAGILAYLGLEFLAVALLIVYAGALSVFFLFVVMLVRERGVVEKFNFLSIINLSLLSVFYFIALSAIWDHDFGISDTVAHISIAGSESSLTDINLLALSQILYFDEVEAFIGGGIVLLLAIIGVIFVTSSLPKMDKTREDGADQLSRPFVKTLDERNDSIKESKHSQK